MKQTAVEWLLDNSHIIPKNELNKKELIEQAKRLENQQKIEMFDKGFDSVEQLNDDYSIEFAEWCDDNYFKNGKGNSNWSASMDWDDNEKFTTKELLEIFKK